MSNATTNPDRKAQLKPGSVLSPNAYSASPSQQSLSSDPTAPFTNPYQTQYTYAPSPQHQPVGGFGFPPQPAQYSPHPLQTQHHGLPQVHQQAQQQSISPTNVRKRRASELGGDGGLGMGGAPFSAQPSMVTNAFGPGLDTGQDPGPSQVQLPSPVAKKGRTNTPWTPAEEQRLKTMRDAGSSWSEIAKTFPLRTEGSVKKHWYKDMHYAEFAEDESAALLQAIKDYETNKWKVIGQKVGKPAKACEQFAKEQGWKV